MKTRQILLAASLTTFALPALASHCPTDVAKIDAALEAGTNLSEEQLAEVKILRDEGAELHKEGKHGESLEDLHKALDILGIDHS